MKTIKLSFDELPQAVAVLLEHTEQIKALLQEREASTSQPDLMSIKQVAEYLNLHTSSIYYRTSQGTIPFIKLEGSKQIRFSRRRIDQWLEKCERLAA